MPNQTKLEPIRNTFQADPEVRSENERKFRNSSSAVEPCFLCGRPLTQKAVDTGWRVHLRTDDYLFPTAIRWFDDPQSQGTFPVGSECAKRIPLAYRFRAS